MLFWSPDLRFAARALRRSPGFTIAVVITLALGIGANTAVFTAIDALLLAPLPFTEAERLVALYVSSTDRREQPASLLDFLDWKHGLRSFQSMAAYRLRSFGLRRPAEPRTAVVQVGMVTSEFLATLGGKPGIGRSFTEEEERDELSVVVLGEELWRREFSADRQIVGRSISLNEEPYTVLGVLEKSLDFAMNGKRPDAYIPLSHADYGGSRTIRSLGVIGRLRPSVPHEQARAELQAVAAANSAAHPDTNAHLGADLRSLHEHIQGKNRRPLLLLLTATALLLGVACINVAGLLLERLMNRGREVAVRASLGAGRLGVIRPFLWESVLLSGLGGLAGLLIARAGLRSLPLILPLLGKAPLTELEVARLQLDVPALMGALALCTAISLLFGLAPGLLTARMDLSRLIRQGGRSAEPRGWLRRSLVAAQISLSLVLLFSTGLLARSFFAVLYDDPGFETQQVLRFGLGLPEARYDSGAKLAAFHQRLLQRLEGIPGVQTAGAVAPLPLGGRMFTTRFALENQPDDGRARRAAVSMISPGYLETMRIPLLEGRRFTWRDSPGSPRVALVNHAFRSAYMPGQALPGTRIQVGWRNDLNPRGTLWEVIGVIGDTRQLSLEAAVEPTIYLPMGQFPPEGCNYVLRATQMDHVAGAVVPVVEELDSQLERIAVGPMDAVKSRSLGDRRLGVFLLGLFAATALLLTAVGIYSAVAIQANRRRQEMAVRMALGAQPSQVAGLVIKEGMSLAAAGVSLGLAGALLASRLIRHQLFNVTATDPATLLSAGIVLGLVALAASAVPARRVTRPENFRRLQDV